MSERERFEAWVSRPPYQRSLSRWGTKDNAWPGQYRDYPVQLAWEAWQAGRRERELLLALLRAARYWDTDDFTDGWTSVRAEEVLRAAVDACEEIEA